MLKEITPTLILLVFYLYLLVRWQYVKRPLAYLGGVIGHLFAMCGWFFALGSASALQTVSEVFGIIGVILAFFFGVVACYGAELPTKIPHSLSQAVTQTQTPPPSAAK